MTGRDHVPLSIRQLAVVLRSATNVVRLALLDATIPDLTVSQARGLLLELRDDPALMYDVKKRIGDYIEP